MSGVHPRTEEQADRLNHEAIAAKNAELKEEALTTGAGPSSGRVQLQISTERVWAMPRQNDSCCRMVTTPR
jgi:hypothetical protein